MAKKSGRPKGSTAVGLSPKTLSRRCTRKNTPAMVESNESSSDGGGDREWAIDRHNRERMQRALEDPLTLDPPPLTSVQLLSLIAEEEEEWRRVDCIEEVFFGEQARSKMFEGAATFDAFSAYWPDVRGRWVAVDNLTKSATLAATRLMDKVEKEDPVLRRHLPARRAAEALGREMDLFKKELDQIMVYDRDAIKTVLEGSTAHYHHVTVSKKKRAWRMKIDKLKKQLAKVKQGEEIAKQLRAYSERCRRTAERLAKKPGLKKMLRRRAIRHPSAK